VSHYLSPEERVQIVRKGIYTFFVVVVAVILI
jgi:hypothetical protein